MTRTLDYQEVICHPRPVQLLLTACRLQNSPIMAESAYHPVPLGRFMCTIIPYRKYMFNFYRRITVARKITA